MKKSSLLSQLRVNILSGPLTSGLNILVMAISYPMYLHYLGYEKVGVWLLLSTVQTFAQLGLLGIGPALTKLVAEERGRGNNARAQAYISLSTAILAITGSIALIALYLFRGQIVGSMGMSPANSAIASAILPWVGLLTALNFLNQATTATLAGVGRIDIANYDATLGKLFALGLEAILLFKKVGLIALLFGDFAGCLVIQVAGSIQLRRIAGLHLLKDLAWDRERFNRLVHFGGSMFVVSLAVLLEAPFNKWALSRYAGVALVPIYDIAFNGSMQLRGLLEVGLRALMPAISHRLANDTTEARSEVRQLYRRTTLSLLAILPVGYVVAIFIAKPMLKLWLGSRFVPQIVGTFDIMSAAAIVSLIAVPAYFTLMASGHVRDCMVSHLISASINVMVIVSAIALTGHLSIYLAATSVLITIASSSLYLLWRASRVVNAKPHGDVAGPQTSFRTENPGTKQAA